MSEQIINQPEYIAGACAIFACVGLAFAVYNLVLVSYSMKDKGDQLMEEFKTRIKRNKSYKLKKPCRYPGCPELTHDRYCEKHKREEDRRQDRERGNSNKRGYNYKWRRARKLYLKQHPICECDECTRLHRLLPANVVHHIIDHKGNYDLFWDRNNWLAMNVECHNKLTLTKLNRDKGRKVYKY